MTVNHEKFYLWTPLGLKAGGAIAKAYLIFVNVPSAEFGSFALGVASMMLLASIFDLKIPQYINHKNVAIDADASIFYGVYGLQVIIYIASFIIISGVISVLSAPVSYVYFYLYALVLVLNSGYISYFRVNKTSKEYFRLSLLVEVPSIIVLVIYLYSFEFDPTFFAVLSIFFYLCYGAYLATKCSVSFSKKTISDYTNDFGGFYKKSYFDNLISFAGSFAQLQLIAGYSLDLVGDFKKIENVFSPLARFRTSLKTIWLKEALREVKSEEFPRSTVTYIPKIVFVAMCILIYVYAAFPNESRYILAASGVLILACEIIFWLLYGVSLRSNFIGKYDYYITSSALRFFIEACCVILFLYSFNLGVIGAFWARFISVFAYGAVIVMSRRVERG